MNVFADEKVITFRVFGYYDHYLNEIYHYYIMSVKKNKMKYNHNKKFSLK